MRRIPYRLALLAGLSLPLPALAQEPPPTAVPEIVVTATRLPLPLWQAPGAYVITEEDIADTGAVVAYDVLRDVPGLSVYRAGGYGGVTSVRQRGVSQDKTLVLIDGVVQNDPSQPSGGFDFSAFDLSDVERIEVLSGPQGSLWGSDAIGGVIAFTTREPDDLGLVAEAGSFDTVRLAGTWGVSGPATAFGISAAYLQSDGISKADEDDGNPEADGYEGTTLGLSARHEVNAWLGVDLRWRRYEAEAEIDGFPPPLFALDDTAEVSDTEGSTGFVRVRAADLGGFDHALTYARSDIDRAISGGAFPSRYTALRQTWRWQADALRLTDRLGLVVGIEHEETEGDLSTGVSESLSATSAFVAARFDLSDRITLNGSLRHDDPSDFEGETTARASLTVDLTGGWVLGAAWGQGFKTPTISQTLCDFCFSASPFPELRPERAEGADLWLAWASQDGHTGLRATLYRLDVEDQIDFFFDVMTFDSFYVNIDRTRSTGLELDARHVWSNGLELRGAYAFTDAEDRSTGLPLLRVPEHAGSVSVGYGQGPWRSRLTVRAEGEQPDAGGQIDSYVVADLSGSYRLSDGVELTARIENLADADYQQLLGYGEPGRSAYLGLRLRY